MEEDNKFGFIVIDGNGALYGTLTGNTKDIINQIQVDLPKKHGRGGQSALRFARLRLEKRHNYLRKCSELATQHFITNDRVFHLFPPHFFLFLLLVVLEFFLLSSLCCCVCQPNVTGLVIAGSAEFKTELAQSDMFDQRLVPKIIKIVDVSYGGESGFNQAIELSADALSNVKFVQEKKLIQAYFDEIALDSGKYCFGVDECFKALEGGAVATLIVWEGLDVNRLQIKNPSTLEEKVVYLSPAQEAKYNFRDTANNVDWETLEKASLVEWLAENYKKYGTKLEFVTNRSQEGAQFVRGFGGMGGLLRYQMEMANGLDDDDFYDSDNE